MQGPSVLSGTGADAAKGYPAAATTTCIDDSSEDDELLSLAGACSPEHTQDGTATCSPSAPLQEEKEEEGEGALSRFFVSTRINCSRRLMLSACCGVLLIVLLFFVSSQMSGDIGGPLGERFPVGNNIGYKGPTWRRDKKCENVSFPKNTCKDKSLLDPTGEDRGEDLYFLNGNETECHFQVDLASRRTYTPAYSFPLPIPPPEKRAGFSYPLDTSSIESKEETLPNRDEQLMRDKHSGEPKSHRELQQLRSSDSSVSSRKRLQPIASLRVSELCKNKSFSSSFSTTIVMGLWRLPAPALHSTKTVKRYMQQFRLGLELFATHAIVMFANGDYLPLVREAVQEAAAATGGPLDHANSMLNRVCIVPLELWELPYSFIGSHVRIAASAAIRDPRVLVDWWNHPYFNEVYHVLQLSKFALTAEVALINPFNSQFIIWTDPPKRKYFPDGSDAMGRFLDGFFLSKSIKKGALLMPATPQRIQRGPWNSQCHKGVYDMHARYAPGLAGGLFGGTPFAFSRVLPVWDAAIRALLSLGILNDEQHLHTWVACSFPSLVHVIPYHPACSPHFLCGSRILAEAHPNAPVSADLEGRQVVGPLPKSIWKEYPFPVSTSLAIPEALYVNSNNTK